MLKMDNSFDPAMFGASPDYSTEPLYKIRDEKKYCSVHPVFCYEKLNGEGAIPDPYKVFLRLYAKADWFDHPRVKKHNYSVWKNAAIQATNGDGAQMHQLLRGIIISYELNPSERRGAGVCKTPECFYDPESKECGKPDFENYK